MTDFHKEKAETLRRAVVVGASSGIGRSVAILLLKDGWHVGIAARRSEPLEEIRRAFPNAVTLCSIDITEADAPQRLQQMIEDMGGIDLYFHSSGYGSYNVELLEELEEKTVLTNALGFTRMVDAAYSYFRSSGRKGHIAAITSIAGTKGLGAAPSYSATKRFQWTYLEALEQNAAITGTDVSFTDIRPGFVDTAFLSGKAYPMLLDKDDVAQSIVEAVKRHRRVVTIDFRYRILCFFWHLIPSAVWRRIRIR